MRQGEAEEISFIFIKHMKYKACGVNCVLLKASEMSRQTNATCLQDKSSARLTMKETQYT